MDEVVLHFSEDPSIEVFHPHTPKTQQILGSFVWAIDEAKSPLYWFPRQCPRVTCWPVDTTDVERARKVTGLTASHRVHAIEGGWLERVRNCDLYVYRLPGATFEAAPQGGGCISRVTIEPLGVAPVGDLLAKHADAGIELRLTPSLWPLADAMVDSTLQFSMVRMGNAAPRP
jgi:hypothetical protein